MIASGKSRPVEGTEQASSPRKGRLATHRLSRKRYQPPARVYLDQNDIRSPVDVARQEGESNDEFFGETWRVVAP
jgi:hypothetical protein